MGAAREKKEFGFLGLRSVWRSAAWIYLAQTEQESLVTTWLFSAQSHGVEVTIPEQAFHSPMSKRKHQILLKDFHFVLL